MKNKIIGIRFKALKGVQKPCSRRAASSNMQSSISTWSAPQPNNWPLSKAHRRGGTQLPHSEEKSKTVFSRKFHIVLSKIVARLSLVMVLYEEEEDDCGADSHRIIVTALKARDLGKAQQSMDHHLADIEGRVRLTEGQGDRHTFIVVLENFPDARLERIRTACAGKNDIF